MNTMILGMSEDSEDGGIPQIKAIKTTTRVGRVKT